MVIMVAQDCLCYKVRFLLFFYFVEGVLWMKLICNYLVDRSFEHITNKFQKKKKNIHAVYNIL